MRRAFANRIGTITQGERKWGGEERTQGRNWKNSKQVKVTQRTNNTEATEGKWGVECEEALGQRIQKVPTC